MSDQIPYLSDEELEKLMADAEAESMIKAPDDLEEKVIARIVRTERKKTVDFASYCLRVGFGVAAAIAFLCIVPSISRQGVTGTTGISETIEISEKEIPTKDEVLKGKEVKTKEEVLNSLNKPSPYDQLRSYFEW